MESEEDPKSRRAKNATASSNKYRVEKYEEITEETSGKKEDDLESVDVENENQPQEKMRVEF